MIARPDCSPSAWECSRGCNVSATGISELRRYVLQRRWTLVMILCSAVYTAQAVHFAPLLYPSSMGAQHLLVGSLAVKGQLSLYDDRLYGNRAPLPFYVLGITQLWGPSFRAARWVNIGFGVLTLLLTAFLARRLAGEEAGILAAAFLVTQGTVVAYYSSEHYFAFGAFCVAAGLLALLWGDSPRHRVLGMTIIGLLFFVRTNLWPAIPFLLGYSLWQARRTLERVLLVTVVVLPPLIFFAWDVRHLKLLAYVPVVRHLVAPLGYISLVQSGDEAWPLGRHLLEFGRFGRRYEFWVLAALILLVYAVWRAATNKPWSVLGRNPKARLLALLFIFLLPIQFVVDPNSWIPATAYFLLFAPIVPILLGIGFSGLLVEFPAGCRSRWVLVVVLSLLFVLPMYFVRNPFYPLTLGDRVIFTPLESVERAAEKLSRAVPHDSKVFFYGWNVVYYLSGLPPTYLTQVYESGILGSLAADEFTLRKSGFVPVRDMAYWLSADADYAVVVRGFPPGFLSWDHLQITETFATLLDIHFDKIGSVENEYPYFEYGIYRRKSRS